MDSELPLEPTPPLPDGETASPSPMRFEELSGGSTESKSTIRRYRFPPTFPGPRQLSGQQKWDGIAVCQQSPAFRWGLLLGTAFLCLLGNLLIPDALDSWPWGYKTSESIALFLCGASAAQLATLAVWAAIGESRFTIRFLVSLFLSVVIGISFLLGLTLAFSQPPVFVVFLTTGTAFFSVLISTGILALISLWTRERLQHRANHFGATTRSESGKFSIAYLIGLTTAAALLVAMLKALLGAFSGSTMGGPAVPQMIEICMITVQYTVLCALIVVVLMQLVLRTQGNAAAALGLLALALVACPVHLFLLSTYRTIRLRYDDYVDAGIYLVGFALFFLLFAAIARLAGYRLVARERSTPS
ncbi:MAG: hypothetical protein AB8B50_21585 [Pirellulaceae bacterium]